MALSKRQGTLYALFLVTLFFATLIVLPRFLTPTQFRYQSSGKPQDATPFPITRAFPQVSPRVQKAATLKEFFPQGKGTLIVNFWATWCAPCIEELPSLERLSRQLASSPQAAHLPRLVTISVDESAEDIQKLFKTLDFKPTAPVLHDPKGAFALSLGTDKFPETYWIDSEGKVLYKWVGPQNWLSQEVLSRLAASAQP